MKNTKNLIKNPSCEENFDHWEVEQGGSGMSFELENAYKDRKTAVCTSYAWCSLTQTIELDKGCKRRIVAGVVANRRVDCGGFIKVSLSADERDKEIEKKMPDRNPDDKWFEWTIFTLKEDLNEEKHRIKVCYRGKDANNWNGHYGTRFGYCFVYAFDLKD
jgi:hypothetical protein